MKRLLTIISIILIITGISSFASADDKTDIHAVVVGINTYNSAPLQWCVNDAEGVQALLTKYGCTTLESYYDRDANRMNVVGAIERAAAKCDESDIFIFFYAGHGVEIPDENYDEDDRKDECCILLDHNGEYEVLLDDVLDEILSDCKAKAVLTIYDSCHSGGVPKMLLDTRLRQLPVDGDELLIQGFQKADKSILQSDRPSNPRQIVLSASMDDELSGESDKLKHGFFSYYLIEALTSQSPVVDINKDSYLSFKEIQAYCHDKVSSLSGGKQNPGIHEGSTIRGTRLFHLDANGEIDTITGNSEKTGLDQTLQSFAQMIEVAGKLEGPRYNLNASCSKNFYNPGEKFDLRVSVNDDCYLYLVNIFYDGEVSLLFPNGLAQDNLIPPGRMMTMNEMVPGYEINVQASSSGGEEYVLVVASPVKLPIQKLLPKALSENYVFGEFADKYGTKGALAKIVNAAYEGCKPVHIVMPNGEPAGGNAPGAVSSHSLAVSIVTFNVR